MTSQHQLGVMDGVARAAELWSAAIRPGIDQVFRVALLDALSEGLVLRDPSGQVAWCTPTLERIVGLSEDQLAGRVPVPAGFRCIREDGTTWPQREHPAIETLRTGRNMNRLVMGVHRGDGELRWVRLATRLVCDDEGVATGVITSFADITEERVARQRFETLARFAPVGISTVDSQGVITLANPQFVELNGFDPTGMAIADLMGRVHPDDVGLVSRALAEALTSTGQQEIEFRLRRQHTYRWLRCRTMQVTHGTGAHGFVVTAENIDDQRSVQDQLTFRATHDPLTGLVNRTVIDERLRELLTSQVAPGRTGRPAVLLVDLDAFKEVNDSLGHEVGDQLLVHAAGQVVAACPPECLVARLGGDEFAVLIPSLETQSDAEQLATRILSAVRIPLIVDGLDISGGCSIGIAVASSAAHHRELLQQADMAMYAAKAQGRNRAVMFDADMGAQVNRRLVVRSGLSRALARSELQTVFQPLVRLQGLSVLGFEALLRWQSAELGPVSPAEFIPLAEESGLMSQIGLWVLDRSLDALEQLGRRSSEVHMSVNVSPRQLTDASFFNDLVAVVRSHPVSAESVVLEITETAIINEPVAISSVLTRIADMGVRIAIDDFGSGNASLSYLRRLPIDIVKVDRTLVQAVDSEPVEARALLRSIIDVAAALELETVAEGIETQEHLDEVTALGFDLGQGYLFSRPMPLDDTATYLERSGAARRR